MQFCQTHWGKMREAVKLRGMESLVPDTGEKVVSQLQRQMEGEDSIDTFDPLMGMHWAILGNIPAYYSIAEGCPLCNVNKDHKDRCIGPPDCNIVDFEWMIDRSADDALAHWQELTK